MTSTLKWGGGTTQSNGKPPKKKNERSQSQYPFKKNEILKFNFTQAVAIWAVSKPAESKEAMTSSGKEAYL